MINAENWEHLYMSDSAHASTVPEVYDEKKKTCLQSLHIHKHTSEAKHWNEPNLDVAWRTDVADGEAALATYKEKKKNTEQTQTERLCSRLLDRF